MSRHPYWLSKSQFDRIRPHLPRGGAGRPRSPKSGRRILSGVIHVLQFGVRWRECPSQYGPYKTVYHRWKHWSERGVLTRILETLGVLHAEAALLDNTAVRARCCASVGPQKGAAPDRALPRWPRQQGPRTHGPAGAPPKLTLSAASRHDCPIAWERLKGWPPPGGWPQTADAIGSVGALASPTGNTACHPLPVEAGQAATP